MLKKTLNIGISDELDMYQKKETRFLNLFSLIIFGSVLVCTLNLFFLGAIYPIGSEIALSSIAIIVMFLNYKKYYTASLFIFVISSNLALLYVTLLYDKSVGNYLFYFPILFCTALLHNPKKPAIRTLTLFFIVGASILSAYYFDYKLITKANTDELQNHYLLLFNISLVSLLTVFVLWLIVKQLNHQHTEFTSLVEQINVDRITIKNTLEEKEILLAEVQHRVKNNLSVILGLFNLQLDQSENEAYRNLLNEAKNRVLSIAMVHQKIYNKSDLSKINLGDYLSDLVREIVNSHTLNDSINVREDLENYDASVTTAVPIGLIVNEVITNSLKHAFGSNKKSCELNISLSLLFGKLMLKITDNGIGFPANYDNQGKSLGLTLINSLSEQLDAEIKFRNENGAVVELSIPV